MVRGMYQGVIVIIKRVICDLYLNGSNYLSSLQSIKKSANLENKQNHKHSSLKKTKKSVNLLK